MSGSYRKDEAATTKYRNKIGESIGLDQKYWSSFYVSSVHPNGKIVMTQYYQKDNMDIPIELAELRGMCMYVDVPEDKPYIKLCPGSRWTKVVPLKTHSLPIEVDENGLKFIDVDFFYPEGTITERFYIGNDRPFDSTDLYSDAIMRPYVQGTYLTSFKVDGKVHTVTAQNLDPSGDGKIDTWEQRWDRQFEEYVEENSQGRRVRREDLMKKRDEFVLSQNSDYSLLAHQRSNKPPVKKASYGYGPAFTDSRSVFGSPSNFFDPECSFSPYSYSEILTTSAVVSASKVPVPPKGFLSLVRYDQNSKYSDDPEDVNYSEVQDEQINTKDLERVADVYNPPIMKRVGKAPSVRKSGGTIVSNGLLLSETQTPWVAFHTSSISVDQANSLLKYGYIPTGTDGVKNAYIVAVDEHLLASPNRSPFGEPLILTKMCYVNGSYIPCSVQLRPPSYEWRMSILEDLNEDIYSSFVYGSSPDNYEDKTLKALNDKFPLYTYNRSILNINQVIEDMTRWNFPFFAHPNTIYDLYEGNLKERIKYTDYPVVCYLSICNPSKQQSALKAWKRHKAECTVVSEYFFNNPPGQPRNPAYHINGVFMKNALNICTQAWSLYRKSWKKTGSPEPVIIVPAKSKEDADKRETNIRLNQEKLKVFLDVSISILMNTPPEQRMEIINYVIQKMSGSNNKIKIEMRQIVDENFTGQNAKFREYAPKTKKPTAGNKK